MNRIIENFLEVHKKEYSIENLSLETAFEHFTNKCIINKYSSERFDPADIMTDPGEKGLDGVAICINSRVITSLDELESILEVDRYDIVLALESNIAPVSLEKEYTNKDSTYTLESTIIDNKKDNLVDLVTLNECINYLTPKEKLLIDLRFYKDLSQKDVAAKFNVSQVQISRLEKQVIDKLKQYF